MGFQSSDLVIVGRGSPASGTNYKCSYSNKISIAADDWLWIDRGGSNYRCARYDWDGGGTGGTSGLPGSTPQAGDYMIAERSGIQYRATNSDWDPSGGGFTGWSSNLIGSNGTSGASGSTAEAGLCNTYWRRRLIVATYTSAEIAAACSSASSATFSKLRFYVAQAPGSSYQPLPNYAIGMKLTSLGQSSNATGTNGGSFTTVKSQHSASFSTGSYKEFTFNTNFSWTSGNNIAIAWAWGQCPTGYNSAGRNYVGSGTIYYARSDSSGTYSITTSSSSSRTGIRPVIQLYGS